MTRISALIAATTATAIIGGWVLGAALMLRVERVEGEVRAIAQRLIPVDPRTALCTLAVQLHGLHRTMEAHCASEHQQALITLPFPTLCGDIEDWSAVTTQGDSDTE